MNAPHTAGPWSFLEEGRTEEEGNAYKPLTICSPSGDDLANVYSSDDATVSIPRAEAIANARLIATAPDLLAALRDVISWVPGAAAWHTAAPQQAVERARAVIAKATGAA